MLSCAMTAAVYGTCMMTKMKETMENWKIQIPAVNLSDAITILLYMYHIPIVSAKIMMTKDKSS